MSIGGARGRDCAANRPELVLIACSRFLPIMDAVALKPAKSIQSHFHLRQRHLPRELTGRTG